MEEQLDILHPLSTVDKESRPLIGNTIVSSQCVLLHDELFLLHEHRSIVYRRVRPHKYMRIDTESGYVPMYDYRTELCAYRLSSVSPLDLKLFGVLNVPSQKCSITTYKSKLIVVGGMNKGTEKAVDTLWTSDTGRDDWKQTLPPLPVSCCQPSVLNISGSPECLIVAGGYQIKPSGFGLCSRQIHNAYVHVMIEERWSSVMPTRPPVHNLILHDERVYISSSGSHGHHLYYCNLKELKETATLAPMDAYYSDLWKEMEVPVSIESSDPSESDTELVADSPNLYHLASFGQQLIVMNNKSHKVSAYSSVVKSWIVVGDFDVDSKITALIELPNGSIFFVSIVNRDSDLKYCSTNLWTLRISPYDPMDRFSISSLLRLEHAGVKIVTALQDNIAQLQSEIGTLWPEGINQEGLSKRECLELVIERWESRTWASLFETIAKMNLTGLDQQIEDCLAGTKQYLDAYQQILATQDCIKMWFFKVILLGAPRLGKTTVRRRLTGEIEDISSSGVTVEPSTGAVESGHSVVIRNLSSTTALVTPSEWLANKNLSEEIVMFLECFLYNVTKKRATSSALESKPGSLSEDIDEDMLGNLFEVEDFQALSPSSTEQQGASYGQQNSGHEEDTSLDASPDTPHIKINAASVSSVPESSATSPHHSKRQSQIRTEITNMFRRALGPRKWKEVKHLFTDTAFIKMEDTGGQPEFMDMLSALTVGPALYLLFCKLTDALQSRYKVSYLSTSGESTVPRESTYTVEEVFFKALASITCSQSSSSSLPASSQEDGNPIVDQLMASCNKSIAYIVGTHKDLVTEEQIDEFDQKLQDSIRPTSFFHDDIVQFSSEQRMVLPVDNMHGGSTEIDNIRKLLEDALKKHFEQLSIPASWLVLSLCLRKREERTASLQSVLLLAEEIGIPKNETMIALWFLHHYAGVLMYFPNLPELKDTVICDNQVIYDSATNVIVNSFRFGSVGKAASERFSKTGQFSLEDIRKATASVSGDYIPLEKLVKLLEHLNILASLVRSHLTAIASCSQSSKHMHFMPCVLQNAAHEELDRFWDLCDTPDQFAIAPLLIRYNCGFVPIGVFPAMIASLSANKSLKIKVEGLKKNRVQFRIGRDFDVVTLISQPKYYAVHITRRQSTRQSTRPPSVSAYEVCDTVRRLVESTLKTVTSQMNYHFSADYLLAFECPSHPGREHLCVVDSDEASPYVMSCLQNMDDIEPVDMSDHHLIWFKKSPSEDTSRDVSDTLKPAAAVASCPCQTRSSVQGSSPSHDQAQQPDTAFSIDYKPKLHQLHCLKTGDKQLRVAQTVGVDWIQLSLSLHFDYNVIKAIERDNCNRTRDCCLELLRRWLEGEACRPITWARLIEALRDAEHGTLADDLKQYFAAL